MANVIKQPAFVNQLQRAVISLVATGNGSNTIQLTDLRVDSNQSVASAPIMSAFWSGTWSLSRPSTNGIANTILALSGSGSMDFYRDGGFTVSTNSTGTITATATGAGTLMLAFRKDSTDSRLANLT